MCSKLRPELIARKEDEESSDIDSDNETSVAGRKGSNASSKVIEGRAQALARYTAKDPAGRDIDLEKGEVSITNTLFHRIYLNNLEFL